MNVVFSITMLLLRLIVILISFRFNFKDFILLMALIVYVKKICL